MEEQQPEKTTAETTTQQTLLYQMEHKYFCPEDEDRSTAEETYILDIFGSSPCKAAHENVLELLVLDNLGISGIGPVNRLCSLAGKVTELDLNGNSLDWPAVGQLLAALPQLRTLNLSHNQLLSQAPQPSLPTALNLTTLILNGLPMLMGTLSAVCQAVPSLKELHLSKGHFPDLLGEAATTASIPVPISSTLQELHLNDCGLREWCQVLAMMRLFSRLQTLFLADNQIASVDQECQCGLATAELSTQMRSLSLSNNRISGWESIENLETLDRLEELRVAHIPLLEDFSAEERLHLIVGRLRSLQVLNGSRIDARQREESERFFIRYYAQSEKKPLIYDQLVAEHGMLDELVRVDLTPKRFAKVAIHCEETDWVRMWIRLRLTGTVLELMKMAARLTNIPLRLMRIFYVDKYLLDVLGPTELRSTQHLKMLHVEDGDEFYVQSKLVWVQESATAKNRQSAQQPAAERQLHQEATAQ